MGEKLAADKMPTIVVFKFVGGFYNGVGMYESLAPRNHLEQAGAQSRALERLLARPILLIN